MREHAVVIVGAGPTGLMLAGELALAKIDVAIVERRASQAIAGSRGTGLHSRTLEVLEQRGIADRFVSEGQPYPTVYFHIPLKFSDCPTRHNYVLGLRQKHTERLLAQWVDEVGVPIYRDCEVTGFLQDDGGVDIELSTGESMRAAYLAGCDGGRSLIRKLAGIEFPGWDATTSWLIAEADSTEEPEWGFHRDALGVQHAIGKGEDARMGIVLTDRQLITDSEPTLDELRQALVAIYGTDFGVHNPVWLSRFTDMTRQAATYRNKRVLLAGDAAHVHPPMGGQGLNLGVQDAVNLGWKLAQVIKGTSPDTLLDTYHAERHPIAARALRLTMAGVALRRVDERSKALSEVLTELLGMDEPRRRFAAEVSGLSIHYEFGAGHPLLGRRMPDLELTTSLGLQRTFALLHAARPILLNFGQPNAIQIGAWSDRVHVVDARYEGQWELPALGAVLAPEAVLIRPDGYVCWVSDRNRAGLTEALTKWFGAAS